MGIIENIGRFVGRNIPEIATGIVVAGGSYFLDQYFEMRYRPDIHTLRENLSFLEQITHCDPQVFRGHLRLLEFAFGATLMTSRKLPAIKVQDANL